MKVTAITQQIKNLSRFSVFLDNEYSFSLSQEDLLEAGLRIGDHLDAQQVARFKKMSEDGKLYDRLLGLLAARPRSRGELENYLDRKKTDNHTKNELLGKLEAVNLINDEDFARRWVENRRLLKPISRRKLRQELLQKRIDVRTIDKVIHEDEADELTVLRELVHKKRGLSKFKHDQQKLMQYLARQGFDYSDIKQVLEEI